MADFIGKGSGTFQSGSIKKGNILFGVDDISFGPSNLTGYYNYSRGNTSGSFTIVEAQSDLESHLKTYEFDNSSDLINFYNANYNSSPGTLQEVVDDVSSNDNLAIIAATDFDDDSLDIDINYEAYNRSHTGTALNKFVRAHGHFSSYSNSGGCDWVCLVNATAEIAAPYKGTVVKKITPSSGTATTIVSSTSNPDFFNSTSVTAGQIVQSNKPIYLNNQSDQHCFAPLNYCGRTLAAYTNRYHPQTVRIFCKHDDTTVHVRRANVTRSVDSTHTGDYGDIITISLNEANYDNLWVFFTSDKPIVGTISGTSGDRFVLPVLSKEYIYRRKNGYEQAGDNSTPGVNSTFVIQDDAGAAAVHIADGAGGDAEAGVPISFLTDTYAFSAGPLKSYALVSGYNQTITAKYWNGSSWTTYDTHFMTGASISSPDNHLEGSQDGSTNLVDGTTRLWLFEGSNPFHIVVNDGGADEEALFGWNRDDLNLAISY